MTLRPRLCLRPDMHEYGLRLQSPAARVLLANILNLMPGTLSAGLDGERLRLHVLSSELSVEDTLRDTERRVAALFGEPMS
jgi:multicomponent Na+:H+ antiporter subunit E